MRPDEFTEALGLSQIPPGITLIALQIIIGWRLDGPLGVILSLLGLLLPSIGLTILLTASYAEVSSSHLTGLALRGVIASVAAMGVVMAARIGRSPLGASAKEGRLSLALSLAVLVATALAYVLLHPPAFGVFIGAGVTMAVLGGLRRRISRTS